MKKIIAILLMLCLAAPLSGCGENAYENSQKVFSSGIIFYFKGYGGNPQGAYGEMIVYLDKLDRLINPNKQDSDVSRINKAEGGEAVEVDGVTYQLLYEAKKIYELTQGAFNVAVYPLSVLWNVNAEGIKKYMPNAFMPPEEYQFPTNLPSPEMIAEVLPFTDLDTVELSITGGKHFVTKQFTRSMIELGGIAKGYAADALKEIAKKYNCKSANINVSGNLYLFGDKDYRAADKKLTTWTIGVNSPRPRIVLQGRSSVCAFESGGNVSVVTSGDYERFYCYSYGGYEPQDFIYIPHIIDGKSGMPVGVGYDPETKKYYNTQVVSSATVIGQSSMMCDALATTICVRGIENASQLLSGQGESAIVFEESVLDESDVKRMSLVGQVKFFKPDVYSGFKDYTRI